MDWDKNWLVDFNAVMISFFVTSRGEKIQKNN